MRPILRGDDPALWWGYILTNLSLPTRSIETMRAFVDMRGIHAFEPRGDAKAGSEYNERVKRRL